MILAVEALKLTEHRATIGMTSVTVAARRIGGDYPIIINYLIINVNVK
jgi:hypothetical protein